MLVSYVDERQNEMKISSSYLDKKLSIQNALLYKWCNQEQWKETLKETVKTTTINRKKSAFLKSINQIKSGLAYKNCPLSIRPKTPEFDCENSQNLSNEWAIAVSSLVPRKYKTLHMVKEEEIANVMQSQLYKDYMEMIKCKGNGKGKAKIKICPTQSRRYVHFDIIYTGFSLIV